jgi:hypothetical protein
MHLCFGGNITYNINKHWSVRGEVWKGNLSASDVNSGRDFALGRNLSFKSRVYEVALIGVYHLSSMETKAVTPYVFGGIARYRINPYTFDTAGTKNFLFPLSTEGQGLPQYPDKKSFSLYNFSIPLGGGITWRAGLKWTLGLEVGFRKTFTDYIDDVSNVYIDDAVLLQERGAKAVELAYRGGELPGGNQQFPEAGSPRGNRKASDWYYNTILRVQFRAFGQPSYKQKVRNRLACPTVF